MQVQRNDAHGFDVGRDVFARAAVAARGGLHELAVLVPQADGQAVEFQFGRVVDRVDTQRFAGAAVKLLDVVVGKAAST